MQNFDMMIILMYAFITVFFIYRVFKQQRAKASLGKEVQIFKKPVSSLEWILFAILLITGGVNFYQSFKTGNQTSMITASVMIVLAIVFMIYTNAKLYITPEGMLISSGFVTFKDIKKWGFDVNAGELVMAVKNDNNVNRETMKVRKEDIDQINALIRKYKLGK